MNSIILFFLVAVSTAYCSVIPLGLGLGAPISRGVIARASVLTTGPVIAPIVAPIAAPIATPIATPIVAPGVVSGAVLAGPSGSVVTKNGAGLGLGYGLGLL